MIPNIKFIDFNNIDQINLIDNNTASVILETIQGGAGFILPQKKFLKAIRKKCNEVGALLILDEIQPGIGRTGKLFAFEHFSVNPDILVFGKGLGGGFPIGAMTTDMKKMSLFKKNPILGHITTFGGHPVISAAAYANLKETIESGVIEQIEEKEKLFRKLLKHRLITEIRGKGLMLALIMKNEQTSKRLIIESLNKGLILFGLLFESKAVRITPSAKR